MTLNAMSDRGSGHEKASPGSPRFVHLRVHSEFSLVDGVVRLKPLVARVAELGMPAVAVTDQSNLFGLVKFYRAALAQGVQPLVGADLLVRDARADGSLARMTLLVQNEHGYRNLSRLLSRAWQEGQDRGVARVDTAWVQDCASGLIALSGGIDGLWVDGGGRPVDIDDSSLGAWLDAFPERFFLEVTRTGRPGEELWIEQALALAQRAALPLVATNDVRFLHADEFEVHEARVCIHDGVTLADPRRPRRYGPQQYLRSPEEMAKLFADLPEALENSVTIARRCALQLRLGVSVLPDFPVPEGRSVNEQLAIQARKGLKERLLKHCFEDPSVYEARIQRELDVICQMGFPGYFLIVADFIRWARENGIPVGPGRGSGAGSLVAYALGITDLDPLRYDLLFERFLNPERVSMPDFDIDFCMDRRDQVIDYVAERYGRDRVSQIITHGTMAAKAVVRDCGRVLGHGYGFVDRIAKLIPFEIGITLTRALAESEDLKALYDQDEDVRGIVDLALRLEGLTRNAGKHAGGVVIAPSALTDFSPVYCEAGGGSLVTHFDKDDVEAVGLVKFDFLGLRTLTIIDWALQALRRMPEAVDIDLDSIPLDDAKTFELLQAFRTTAVFQLESSGIRDLIRRLQPDSFEDIIALVALYRPGPLQSGMVDDFIDRKHGRSRVEYPHPDLEPILKPTYGVILYQEQVMQIAQVLAGYSLGGADLLRRAMGKKKPEEMAKQREVFMEGSVARGVDADLANSIFDLMEKFAGYGFNKSHSAAYALLAYQTAWLKAHHPAAFMAAVLSADMDHTDKVVGLIEECRGLELVVMPPDINRSEYRFIAMDAATIVYGLGAIKGVGESAIDQILAARQSGQGFQHLVDLCQRVDLGRVNRRVLETLIRAGAMDSLGENRATLLVQLPLAIAAAEQIERNAAAGVLDLFGEPASVALPEFESLPEMDDEERLRGEKETLGLYLTGHPIARYRDELRRMTGSSLNELMVALEKRAGNDPTRNGNRARGEPQRVAGLVIARRSRNTQNGRMVIVTLDDQSGRSDLVLFGDELRTHEARIQGEGVLVAEGMASVDEYAGGVRLRVQRVLTLDEARAEWARFLLLELSGLDAEEVRELFRLLAKMTPGRCEVRVRYRRGPAIADLSFAEPMRIHPMEDGLRRLSHLLGPRGRVAVHY